MGKLLKWGGLVLCVTALIVSLFIYATPRQERFELLRQLRMATQTGERAVDKMLAGDFEGMKKVLAGGVRKLYLGDWPSLASMNMRDAVVEEIFSGLEQPWSMEFLSPTELLIAEFPGKLQKLDLPSRSIEEISGLPDIPPGEGHRGLMDVALHPDFAHNAIIYFSHAIRETGGDSPRYATAVSRARLNEDRLEDVEAIFVATPFGASPSNFGGALAFDDRRHLYVGTGDRSERQNAQDLRKLTGKIIRLTETGGVPADNPFADSGDIDQRIYAYGVRNPQGLVFDKVRGVLYETEHGPMGGDEVNVVEAGRNYGWPVISYGANYTYERLGVGTNLEGMEQPLFYYLPSIAASPIELYSGDMFPEWQGDLLVGALRPAQISKIDIVDGVPVSETRILTELPGRYRDIKVAADGSVFVLAEFGGSLYRLYRDPDAGDLLQLKTRSGAQLYRTICASCHSSGTPSIVQLGDKKVWRGLAKKGRSVLHQNAIDGIGAMPPRGLCETCTNEEIANAVDFMLEKGGQGKAN